MDQTLSTLIAAAVPTIAVIGAHIATMGSMKALAAQLDAWITRLDREAEKRAGTSA